MLRPIHESSIISRSGEMCVYFTWEGLLNPFFFFFMRAHLLDLVANCSRGTLFTIKLWASLQGIEREYLYTQLSDC